jgi:hypothetical protein
MDYISKKPFQIEEYRVKRARPFKTINDVAMALKNYKKGLSIGFSRKSSLIAMGLLPRVDGMYRVSEKYQ